MLFILFTAEASIASSGQAGGALGSGGGGAQLPDCVTLPNQVVSPQDAVALLDDCVTGVDADVHNTTYFRLCEIRRFFCGKVKTVLIATAIFIMGMLILAGKAKWNHALIMVIGIIIFSSAEWITIQLTTFPPNFGVVYSCFCIDEWTDIYTNFTRLFSF